MAGAHEFLSAVLDPGSFASWDEPVDISAYPEDYRTTLIEAATKSGVDEAVITGVGRIHDRPVAVLVGEFAFLGGSIGRDAADRLVGAIRRATAERLPLVASTASGGTRMQEGTPAFVRMADISLALADHKAAGLPYLVHLRNPTTGGVFASWGALGHLTIAEPSALVGFLGPKVFEALNGTLFPPNVQVSDRLAAEGVIDAVVPDDRLRPMVATTLSILLDPATASTRQRREAGPEARADVWANIEHTRSPDRPGLRDLLDVGSDETILLSGTGAGERNPAVLVALARIDGVPCVVIGHDRVAEAGTPLGPAGLRQAQRGMAVAEQLGLPVVTVVDTAGAELSERAELGAAAREIGRTLAQLTSLRTASVSVLLGQGCGGGALALLPAKRVIATERAWLSPLPLEGASTILFRTVDRAAEIARLQRVGADDLRTDGIVHHVVPELDDDDAQTLCTAVAAEVGARLRELNREPD